MKNTVTKSLKSHPLRETFIITGTYCLLGIFWAVFSERFIVYLVSDFTAYRHLELYHKWLFVLFSSAFFFIIYYYRLHRAKQLELSEERSKRALQMYNECIQTLFHDLTEDALLNDICRIITETGGYRVAWVGYPEHDSMKNVRLVAKQGYKVKNFESLSIRWDDSERGLGVTGRAINMGNVMVSRNLSVNTDYMPWRDFINANNIKSSISLPLIYGDTLIGALTISSEHANAFNDDEITLLTDLSRDLAFGIAAIRTKFESETIKTTLLEKESLLLDTGKMAKVGGWEFDIQTGEGTWTDEVAYIHDLEPSEVTSKQRGLSYYHGEHLQAIENAIKNATESGTPFDLELEMVTTKGNHKWVRTIGHPIMENSKVVKLRGSFQDITHMKNAEEALRRSEQYQRTMIAAAPLAIISINPKGFVQSWNAAAERIFGWSENDIINQVAPILSDIISKGNVELHTQILAGEPFSRLELTVHRKNGSEIYISLSTAPLFDRNNHLIAIIAIIEDITTFKRNEEERELLSKAIEQSGEIIVITDPEGTIQYANPAFERITGYTREDIFGKNPRILRSGNHDISFYQALWNTIKSGNTWTGHLINRKKDGKLYEENATISPIKDKAGNITNFLAVKRDITDERKMEQRLLQAQKMEAIGTLAGGIAHDFNNILSAIIGYSELAMLDVEPESELSAELKQILKAGNRAKDLVNQILAFSRNQKVEKKLLIAGPIVREALKLLRATIPATIEFHIDIDTDVRYILCGPTELHQIVMNLCTNAAHAMRETGGVLSVSLKETYLDDQFISMHPDTIPGHYLKLSVSDTGHGIKPEDMDRIFDPYFTSKKTGEGTGLGLSVVHGIVDNNNGLITVYSEFGKGTTVNVFLPVILGDEIHSHDMPEEIPTGTEYILVVDDESMLADVEKRALEKLNYRVDIRTDGVEALELIRNTPDMYDLVITDMTMPLMTGEELAAHLLEIRPDLPIILVTGFSDRINEEKALAEGIRAYMSKPLDTKKLAHTIRTVLDNNAV